MISTNTRKRNVPLLIVNFMFFLTACTTNFSEMLATKNEQKIFISNDIHKTTSPILDCDSLQTGTFTQTLEPLTNVIVMGKPDYKNGLMIPVPICNEGQIEITIEQTITATGNELKHPPRIYLFRSLHNIVPEGISAHQHPPANVEHNYLSSENGVIETAVSTGLYLFVIQHNEYNDLIQPKTADEIPHIVTYHLKFDSEQ